MAKSKKSICVSCGKEHWSQSDLCRKCARDVENKATAKFCAICGERIPKKYHSGRSYYCGAQCKKVLTKARSRIAYVIQKNIRTGCIPRAKDCKCVDCGKPATEYDHREYLKPLSVVPVCKSCNGLRGPADDIKQFIAKHLGVGVDELVIALRRYKKYS